MKRFWTEARVVPRDAEYGIDLDGKPLCLPAGSPLAVPSRKLAEAIAAEWNAASGDIAPDALAFTRLAGTALERIAPDPAPVRAGLLAYGRADLLCYRTVEPAALAAQQHASWQPWLDWAERTIGARLESTSGIAALNQPATAMAALGRHIDRRDSWSLASLGVTVPALGSLVLGLAVDRGALAPGDAHALAILDEIWQERRWGTDPESQARRAALAAEIASAAAFANLARL